MILVTGATGRLGGHVVRALRRMGQPVRALVRKGSEYFWLNDTGCAYFFGDLRDPASLDRACRGVQYLVACSAVELETRHNDHLGTTVAGHEALWQAARKRGVEHAVYVSAMGVDRGYPVPWFDAKAQVERSLADSGLSWTVLRPAVYSRVFAEVARIAARRGSTWVPGPASNRVAPVALRDVALLAIVSLELDAMHGRAVEIAGAETMTARDALDRALALGGDGGTVRALPGPAAAGLARLARMGGRRWTHRLEHLRRWFTDDFTVPVDDLVSTTGIALTSYEESLRADFSELLPLEDPNAREDLVVHRRFDATVYAPGEVDLESLPTGPLRYDE